MTPHNEAQLGDIAKTVLMPGDPLRAKYIAENYLQNARVVNTVRNMYGFTGTYKGKEITVFASGMGMPSMGIYAYELYKFYAGKFIKKPLLCTCENYSDGMQFFTSLNYIKFKKKAKRDEYKKGSCVSVSFDDFDDLIL